MTENTRPGEEPDFLQVRGLRKWFLNTSRMLGGKATQIRAVTDVSFSARRGSVVGLVGESGSGKSTTGHCIIRLLDPTEGQVVFDGHDITRLGRTELLPFRRRIQMVFQDPFSSLNPRMSVGDSIAEPLEIYRIGKGRKERREHVAELMHQVGLRPELAKRYPHEFSGGQRQRIGIARALAVRPELVIADEPVSALDVSVQAQIIELLNRLKDEYQLTILMIAHDLAVVRYVSDQVVVMYLGRVVESGPTEEIFKAPAHPYTKALLAAAPSLARSRHALRATLGGEIPSPINPPSGCVFRTRCSLAEASCAEAVPELRQLGRNRWAACHLISQTDEKTDTAK